MATRAMESRVKLLRKGRGWSQERLAGLAGVPLPRVRAAERGEILRMTIEQALRIANTLDVSVAECWPLLGPLPRSERKSVSVGLTASLAEYETKRAERWQAVEGDYHERA